MFLHGLDISHTFRLHEGLPVMRKGLYVMYERLPVMCKCLSAMHHDCNSDSCMVTMTSQCENDDVIHAM